MRRALLSIFVMPLIFGCAGTETPEVVNQAPSINFTFTPIAVEKGVPVNLSVSVADPDGDPLTVEWHITGSGSLTPQNATHTIMQWDTPDGVGSDTVVVTVSDGELTATTDEEIIKRATMFYSPSLNNFTFLEQYSPYLVDPGDESIIRFTHSGTVHFQKNVEVYIGKPGLLIEFAGNAYSNGTASEPVVIQPNDRTLDCVNNRDWWEGLLVVKDDQARDPGYLEFEYTEVRHAKYGVRVFTYNPIEQPSATLRNCWIKCCDEAGILMASAGTLIVDRCEVSGSRNYGIDISSGSVLPESVVIQHNHIHNNDHSGIHMDLLDGDQTVPITIRFNSIEFNSVTGVSMTNAVWPTIRNNDFFLNGIPAPLLNIYLDNAYASGVGVPGDWATLPADSNYWGQAYDASEIGRIEETVRDHGDNPSVPTTVDVAPWANVSQYAP
jgi:hypothetical protein